MQEHARSAFVAVLAFALFVSCQTQEAGETGGMDEAAPADLETIRTEIESLNDRWEQGAMAGDAAAVAALYAEDAVLMPPNAPRAEGRAAIESALADMFEGITFDAMTLTTDEVGVAESGELAYTIGTFSGSFTGADGVTMQDSGKFVLVVENVDGEWMAVADIWNTDTPIPGMDGAASEGGAGDAAPEAEEDAEGAEG